MKKLIKKVSILSFVFVMICSSFICNPVHAAEPKSGGYVSTSYIIDSVTEKGSYWKYVDLVEDWAPTEQYIVTKEVSVSYSSSFNYTQTVEFFEDNESEFGVEFTSSVSNSYSIGRVIHVDYPSRNSKLRFKVYMNRYYVDTTAVDTYYDTSLGYYTRTRDFKGYITVPNSNKRYIEVYYE